MISKVCLEGGRARVGDAMGGYDVDIHLLLLLLPGPMRSLSAWSCLTQPAVDAEIPRSSPLILMPLTDHTLSFVLQLAVWLISPVSP